MEQIKSKSTSLFHAEIVQTNYKDMDLHSVIAINFANIYNYRIKQLSVSEAVV